MRSEWPHRGHPRRGTAIAHAPSGLRVVRTILEVAIMNRSIWKRALGLALVSTVLAVGHADAQPVVVPGTLEWKTGASYVLYTNPVDNGLVGIGTSQPKGVLHIAREIDAALSGNGNSG